MAPQQIAGRHRARASAALEIGRYALAETEARAALAVEPQSVDANLYLARALLGMSRYGHAVDAARAAVALAPRDAYAHYLVGFALQAGGQSTDATEALREAVRLNPRAARYHARLAIALLDGNDPVAARACIESALALDSDNAYLLDEAARVYGVLGPLERAEDLARRVVQLTPASASAHWRLAWVLGLRRRFVEAAVQARAAIEIDQNNWPAWDELGFALFEQGALGDAEGALREALRLKPGLHSAAMNLATLLWKRGAIERAEAVCDAALVTDPSNRRVRKLKDSLRAARERRKATLTAQKLLLASLFGALASCIRLAERPVHYVIIAVLMATVLGVWWLVGRRRADTTEEEPPT